MFNNCSSEFEHSFLYKIGSLWAVLLTVEVHFTSFLCFFLVHIFVILIFAHVLFIFFIAYNTNSISIFFRKPHFLLLYLEKQLLLLKYKYLQPCLPVLLNSFYTCSVSGKLLTLHISKQTFLSTCWTKFIFYMN